jgi:hypothetical protein
VTTNTEMLAWDHPAVARLMERACDAAAAIEEIEARGVHHPMCGDWPRQDALLDALLEAVGIVTGTPEAEVDRRFDGYFELWKLERP